MGKYKYLIFCLGGLFLLGCQEENHTTQTAHTALAVDDNRTSQRIALGDITVNEGDGYVLVPYTLFPSIDMSTYFLWSTQDDSAVADQDYILISYQREDITPNATQGTLRIEIINDTEVESNERFKVIVQDMHLDIIDNAQGLQVTVTLDKVSVSEADGYALIPYTLSRPIDMSTYFLWSTQDISATAGVDYISNLNQREDIAPNATQGALRIEIINDEVVERRSKFFGITTQNVLPSIQATVTVKDDHESDDDND